VTSRERNPQFCGTPNRFRDRGFYSIQPEELTCPESEIDLDGPIGVVDSLVPKPLTTAQPSTTLLTTTNTTPSTTTNISTTSTTTLATTKQPSTNATTTPSTTTIQTTMSTSSKTIPTTLPPVSVVFPHVYIKM